MSGEHTPTLAPEHGAGVATRETVSFDIQPLLLLLVTVCVVVSTVVIVKSYLERKQETNRILSAFEPTDTATLNGAKNAPVKEAR